MLSNVCKHYTIVGGLDTTHYCKFSRTQWHCHLPAPARKS